MLKTIIAHCVREEEFEAAVAASQPGAIRTEAFVLGDLDDSGFEALEQRGVIIEIVGPDLPSVQRADASQGREEWLEVLAGLQLPAPPSDAPDYYRVSLRGPLLADWREQLSALGVVVLEALPSYSVSAKMLPATAQQLRDVPFVSSVDRHTAIESLPPAREVKALSEEATGVKAMLTWDILLREAEALTIVVEWLEAHHVNIGAAKEDKLRIYLLEGWNLLAQIAAIPAVARIEAYIPPDLHNDHSRHIVGLGGSPVEFPYHGAGEIVAVADTGVDSGHPDLADRCRSVAWGRSGDCSDPTGHGTHVVGCVIGDGSASAGQIRGIAPQASVFFQSLFGRKGPLAGLPPLSLRSLFGEAYAQGARIHNDSWGSPANSAYRTFSDEVDKYVHQHRDMLIVISAGNGATAADPQEGWRNSQAGFVDWVSIDSPATAKNALAVGANRSSRTSGGRSRETWREYSAARFRDDPIGSEALSGDTQYMAAFSGRGPCDDYRIKPDVVAPGTSVLSCRSSQAPLSQFWGAFSENDRYAYLGGTSVAAPIVAGCAAIVREFYLKERSHRPSAALIKATLINGARWLLGDDAIADHPHPPNYHQGFGQVDMRQTLPNAANAQLALEYVDDWEQPDTHFQRAGDARLFRFSTSEPGSLRICLAYTDAPGRALQNNINVSLVEDKSGSATWYGNQQRPANIGRPDTVNNVEIIRLSDAARGEYLVKVAVGNMVRPPQDYALVVTGRLSTQLVRLG